MHSVQSKRKNNFLIEVQNTNYTPWNKRCFPIKLRLNDGISENFFGGNFGIIKHCKSLKNLEMAAYLNMNPFLDFVTLNEEIMMKSQPLFANLEKLSFENCLLTDYIKTGLIGCQKLKFLQIKNTLLEEDESEIIWYDSEEREEREGIMPFVNLHTSELFQSIGENTPNLEELHIHIKYMEDSSNFQRDILCLCNLKSLKVLEMHMYAQSASNFMTALAENNIQIEDLKLTDGKIDITGIQSMSKIKSIKKIQIVDFYTFDVEYLVPLAEGLPLLTAIDVTYPEYFGHDINAAVLKKVLLSGKKLSNLSIMHSNYSGFGLNDYQTILTIIQNREDKIGLKFFFGCLEMDIQETFKMETELNNGEKLEVSVYFYLKKLGLALKARIRGLSSNLYVHYVSIYMFNIVIKYEN